MKKAKIIILEGNIQNLKKMKSCLEIDMNCEVIAEANSTDDFLELKNIALADFILIDVDLDIDSTGGSGFIAAMKIMMQLPDVKVIAISNTRNMYLEEMFLKLGFKGVVGKSCFYSDTLLILKDLIPEKITHNL